MTDLLLAIDPEKVKPGWLGLFVVLAIAVALVFLLRSLSHQLKKVDFPESDLPEPDGTESDPEPRADEPRERSNGT